MPRANTTPAALRQILKQEWTLGQKLLILTQEESDVIIRNDLERLNALQTEQQQCLQDQQKLEAARAAITRDLAWSLGLERVPPLSELIAALPVREQESLLTLRADLLKLHQQLEIVQARNRRLLDNALEYVRFSLETLTTAALQPARYGANLRRLTAPTFYIDSKA